MFWDAGGFHVCTVLCIYIINMSSQQNNGSKLGYLKCISWILLHYKWNIFVQFAFNIVIDLSLTARHNFRYLTEKAEVP